MLLSTILRVVNPKKQELFAAVINPIIKLSECSWYNIFSKWYYGRQEKKNRAIFESEIIKFNSQKNELVSAPILFSSKIMTTSVIKKSNNLVSLEASASSNTAFSNHRSNEKLDLHGNNSLLFKGKPIINEDY